MRKCSIELVDNGFIVRNLDDKALVKRTVLVYPHLGHLLDFLHAEFTKETKSASGWADAIANCATESHAKAFNDLQNVAIDKLQKTFGSPNDKIRRFDSLPETKTAEFRPPPEKEGAAWKINPPGKLVIARPGDAIRADGVVIPRESIAEDVQIVKKKAKSARRRK